MPIEIKDCDGGIGHIIESRGMVTDQECMDSLKRPLTYDRAKFKKYKYILIDHTTLTKVVITNETVELIAGLWVDASRANPDTVVAMVTNVTFGANIGLTRRVSRMYELFVHRSCWETMVFRTKSEAVRWIKRKVGEKFGIDDLTFC